MLWLMYLFVIAAGTANPFQSGTNAQLNKQMGEPLWAGAFVYAIGLAGLLLLQSIFGRPFPGVLRLAGISWWAWLGGLISIGSTMAGLVLAQKLGSGVFTGLSITAAITTSVLIDQFGWIGFRHHPASPARIVGCALMIVGVWLVARF